MLNKPFNTNYPLSRHSRAGGNPARISNWQSGHNCDDWIPACAGTKSFRSKGLSRLIPNCVCSTPTRARQQGVTLLISLIVLVVMTLAGIELMRSVDTTNVIAGNLAFQQAATHSGDSGIEAAIDWLENQNNASPSNLYSDNCNKGYNSSYNPIEEPTEPLTSIPNWDLWWSSTCTYQPPTLLNNPNPDASGNTVFYAINRLCKVGNAPTTFTAQYCSTSPVVVTGGAGNGVASDDKGYSSSGQVYYRITSLIIGPRQTKSYVQAIVSM